MLAARNELPERECFSKGAQDSVDGEGEAIELQHLLWQRVEQERDMAGLVWLAPPSAVESKSRFANMADPIIRIGSRILGPLALLCAVGALLALFL
jgi:hypothetical protein